MAKVTRIKANDSPTRREEEDEATITRKKVVVRDKKTDKEKRKEKNPAEKRITEKGDSKEAKGKGGKSKKKPFILIRPLVYLGRYLRDSWRELRQVRWPNRKATWKMVVAVLVYTALFVLFISLLDLFFTWLFNMILSK